jgi:ferrous iron transport protein B
MKKIALLGNPNCGKTTVFNLLTGSRQKVGNWPGVTVEKKYGFFAAAGHEYELVDLPGVYALGNDFKALDEQIAQDYLATGDIDTVINVVDASNLERSLVLTQQLLERGLPTLVVVNMLDVAKQQGMTVDTASLALRLGVPVVDMVASRRAGVGELFDALSTLPKARMPHAQQGQLENQPAAKQPAPREIDDEAIVRRYATSRALLDGVVEVNLGSHGVSEAIDKVVLNRWLGVPFFLLMIYLMFAVAINLGAVFIDFFDILFSALFIDGCRWLLDAIGAPPVVSTLLADGLGGGITLVATFIPVIGFLYLCLSFLEDSGYLARAAFVIDRLMAGIGLPGNAFVPLIVGFGCNVPAVMAARTLARDSDRLMTIAMAPFMSCGARLTVYALFAAAFFPSNGQNIVFGLYLLGIGLAVFTGWIFRRQLFATEITPSFQEMPAYHLPIVRNIAITTWFRLRGFILRAGKTIVAVVMGLSLLNSIGSDLSFGNEDSERSLLSLLGKSITPAFVPMGIGADNWPATVGLFTGMFAKEAIVGTLDALYNEEPAGDDEASAPNLAAALGSAVASVGDELVNLRDTFTDPLGLSIGDVSDAESIARDQEVATTTLSNMAQLFPSAYGAFCYLVFVLLYAPCVAVLGAISKEAGWRYMLIVFGWSTGLAYATATSLYQLGTFSEHALFSAGWIVCALSALVLFINRLKRFGTRALPAGLIPVKQL